MSIIISVYTNTSFHEFIMPSLNNADYSLSLYKNLFGLTEDLSVRFEVVDHEWRICPGEGYRLYAGSEIGVPVPVRHGDAFRLASGSGAQVSLLVREVGALVQPFTKYDISTLSRITVGKRDDNTICYDCRGMVSGVHAVLERENGAWVLHNLSANGLYVNAGYVSGAVMMRFGDYVNIVGLHFVFLGNYLAVDTTPAELVVDESVLHESEITGNAAAGTGFGAYPGDPYAPAGYSPNSYAGDPYAPRLPDLIPTRTPPPARGRSRTPPRRTASPAARTPPRRKSRR